MTSRSTILSLSAALAVAVLASSVVLAGDSKQNDSSGQTADDASVTIETAKLVDGRRAGFWMSAGLFGGMNGVIESGGDVKGLSFAARTLAGWAQTMPGLFPDGAVNEKSNALPTVWSDRAGFDATAKLYQERAVKLSQLAKAGDQEAFKAQWAVVRETCNTCHETYRKKTER